MRLLLINAHQSHSAEKFEIFKKSVIKVSSIPNIFKLMTEQKELIDTENEFHVRDKSNIDDYLYELETSYVKKENAHNFDQIDIIFISGDANFRPWSKNAEKFLTLLRMCIKVKKLVFACSFGFQALIYLSATDLERNINIINGVEGGKLSEIRRTAMKSSVKHNDFFLEHTSGDLYYYNYDQQEWIPRANVGMHQRRAGQEYQSIGKFMIKVPTYKPKEKLISSQTLTLNTECFCYLKKTHYQDFVISLVQHLFKQILQDIPYKFPVPMLNSWDVHPFSFTNASKTFVCLGESDYGMQMITYPSIFACQFEIDQKYPCTIAILSNYIVNVLRKLKDQKQDIVLLQVLVTSRKPNLFQLKRWLMSHSITLMSRSKISMYYKQESLIKQHKREVLTMMETRKNTHGISSEVKQKIEDESIYNKDIINRQIRHVGYSIKRSHMPDIVNFNSVWEKKVKMSNSYETKLVQNRKIVNTDERRQLASVQEHPILINNQSKKLSQRQSQGQIRQYLHPNISDECLNFSKFWIPGSSTLQDVNDTVKNNHSRQSGKYFTSSRTSSNKEFKSIQQLHLQSPYITYEQIKKEDQRKIIGGKRFVVNLDRVTKDIPNYVMMSASPEINKLQKFRDVNKARWVSKDNFIV